MSKINNLEKWLSPLIQEASLEKREILEATTNLQEATKSSAVFYRLTNAPNAEDIFSARWNSEIGCLITNQIPKSYTGPYIIIKEEDFLPAQKCIADNLYPLKDKRAKIIGVTGTNGKTTTTDFIRQFGNFYKKSVATVGTLGVYLGGSRLKQDIHLTSPPYLELRKILYELEGRADLLVIEASSHALSQNRFYDIKFDLGIWTSFSQDHLDYHKTFENYFESKVKLGKSLVSGGVLLVSDRASTLKEKLNKSSLIKNLQVVMPGTEEFALNNPLFRASYNRINVELAWEAFHKLFPNNDLSKEALEKLESPPGRFMSRQKDNKLIVVDYAHTPAALENICKTLSHDEDKKLLTVFGCGGDRDKEKREAMGAIACQFSDKVIVTSDNPRSEDPWQIIKDIAKGCSGDYETVVDRGEAIKKAIEDRSFPIVLIAGKGHEEYQEVQRERIPFSDIKLVDKYLEESS